MKTALTSTKLKTARGKTPRPVWVRGFNLGTRLALIACVLWACWSATATWSHLLGWWPMSSQEEAVTPETPNSLISLAPFPVQGNWSFPGLGSKIANEASGGPLLPLPAEAKRVGQRLDAKGLVYCEILTTQKTLGEVTAYWEQQGWSVAVDPLVKTDNIGLICKKGSETVIVWTTADDPQEQTRTLILLRGVGEN